MKSNIIQLSTLFCFLCGCGASEQETLKEFNSLKVEVKNNYINNKEIFSELKSCFSFKYIKVIEFKKNNDVFIEYKMSDTSKWEKTEININNKDIKSPLNEEGVSAEYLFNLKTKLNSIKANSIWIIDLFNRYNGSTSKGMEIKYLKEVNDLHFFYKMFEKSLDSIPNEFYTLQTQDSIGGVLDKNIIFYYR